MNINTSTGDDSSQAAETPGDTPTSHTTFILPQPPALFQPILPEPTPFYGNVPYYDYPNNNTLSPLEIQFQQQQFPPPPQRQAYFDRQPYYEHYQRQFYEQRPYYAVVSPIDHAPLSFHELMSQSHSSDTTNSRM